MKKILSLILLTSIMSCSAQNKAIPIPLKKMETLNNKSFDEIQINGEAKFTLPNGNSVRQSIFRDAYIEDIKIKGTPFSIQNIYSKPGGAIQSSLEVFYRVPIGIKKLYDGNGNVIKEIDFDKPFQFSIDDLALKIKNEFNLDIMKDNNYVNVFRTLLIRDSIPLTYTVAFPVDLSLDSPYGDKRILEIDGNTGAIISNTIKSYTK